MKYIFIVILIFFNLNLSSQSFFKSYEKGSLQMKNGTTLRGFIKISGNRIKYKKTKQDKKQIFDYTKVSRLKFLFEDEYLFKTIKKNRRTILLKREIKGKIDLYSVITEKQIATFDNSGVPTQRSYTDNEYYTGKEKSDYVEFLPDDYLEKKFREILSNYAFGCKDFLNRIKTEASIKYFFEKDEEELTNTSNNANSIIKNIINYHNNNCY